MINRRKVVQGIGAGAAVLTAPSVIRAQELRKIRMGFGIKSVNPIVINILIAEGLGYNREEGLAFTPAAPIPCTTLRRLIIFFLPSVVRGRPNGSGSVACAAR